MIPHYGTTKLNIGQRFKKEPWRAGTKAHGLDRDTNPTL